MTYTNHALRKSRPLATGVLDYFPDALLAVAECSRIGNEQHNPGQPLHWAKEKSTDEPDALLRHLIDRGTVDTDGIRHSAKVAWRALAMLQREIEAEQARAGFGRACVTQPGDRKTYPVDPDAKLPNENAKQHRDRVNRPWPIQGNPKAQWETLDVDPRFQRQPDDFAEAPELRENDRRGSNR